MKKARKWELDSAQIDLDRLRILASHTFSVFGAFPLVGHMQSIASRLVKVYAGDDSVPTVN